MNVFGTSKRGVVGLLAAAVLGSVLGLAPAAQAVVYQPCNAHDLREAVQAANLTPEEDVIKLSPKCKYVFTSPDRVTGTPDTALVVVAPLTIAGNGATISISGSDNLRHIYSVANLTLNNLTLRGGRIKSPYATVLFGGLAGSIAIAGADLRGDKLTVKDNEIELVGGELVTAAAGGIYAQSGDVTLVRSTVADNKVTAYGVNAIAAGGGIYLNGGELTLTRSTVKGNVVSGAAVTVAEGLAGGIGVTNFGVGSPGLTLTESTVSGNVLTVRSLEALAAGGGIVTSAGVHTMSKGTVSGNRVTVEGPQVQGLAGGILNGGELADSESTISGNRATCKSEGFCRALAGGYGNAITGAGGVATFEETTFTGNKADAKGGFGAGGGLAVAGGLTRLVEATVTKNEAKGAVRVGGGIADLGTLPTVDIDASDIFKNKPDDCWNVPACDN